MPDWTARAYRRLCWRVARLFHAGDALLLRYRYPRVTAWVQRQYPRGYVHECPPWAMRGLGHIHKKGR